MLEYFSKSPDWEKSNELCEEVIEILNAYRILTLNAVESIIKWKEQLVYALILNKSDSIGKHKSINFMWEDQNYVIKMRNDIDFLFRSDFAKILSFAENRDPMLLVPSKPLDKKNFKTYEFQKFLAIPTMLVKRVKLAEQYILDEERDPEESKADIKPPNKINEKAAKKILEDLIEKEFADTIEKVAKKTHEEEKKVLNQAAGKKIRGDIIKEVVYKIAKDVAGQVYQEVSEGPIKKHMEAILSKYVEEEIDKIVKEIIKEERKNAKESMKEAAKNDQRSRKEKELAEKKRKEEEAALEKRLAKEREENEKKRKAEEALKKKQDEENYSLAKLILEWLLKEIHVDIELLASSVHKEESDSLKNAQHSSKAHKLMMSQIAEQIHRILIEEEINALNLNEIAEIEVNKAFEKRKSVIQSDMQRKLLEERERSILNDRLSEMIYVDLFEDLLVKIKFEKIPEKMIEKVNNFRNTITIDTSLLKNVTVDPDDYAVDEFTPGEHSPQLYELNEESRIEPSPRNESPLKYDEVLYEFSIAGDFSDVSDFRWVPIHIHESNIEEMINDYYSSLPEIFNSVLPNVSQLLLETYKGIDPCWFWAVKDSKIIGSLVFSLDHLSENRKVIIHHISVIDLLFYEKIIDSATYFIFEQDSCEEIRVNLLVPMGKELNRDVKKVFTNLKFKWKASADSGVPNCDLNVMGKVRDSVKVNAGKRTGDIFPFILKSGCLVEPSDSSVAINNSVSEEMTQFGNRQCQVNSILNLFGKLDKSGILLNHNMSTRLQGEISDILEIINSTDSFNFPNINAFVSENPALASEFLKQHSFFDFTTTQKSSISLLDLQLKFVGCTYVVNQVKGNSYKFLRFKSPDIHVGIDINIFSVPTNNSHIRALFISYDSLKEEIVSETRRDKTDLFYKIENVLKGVNYRSEGVTQFSVPVFKKKANWIIPWMQGYEIPPQRNEKASQFVKKCFETVKVSIEAPEPAFGILNLEKSRGKAFESDFVFCLTHTGLDRVLDMPLFVCLVEPKDWVPS